MAAADAAASADVPADAGEHKVTATAAVSAAVSADAGDRKDADVAGNDGALALKVILLGKFVLSVCVLSER